MSWIGASDYLAIEQAVHDRLGEVERFSSERAFRPETPRDGYSARGSCVPGSTMRCTRRACELSDAELA
jgi:hypothetical protein